MEFYKEAKGNPKRTRTEKKHQSREIDILTGHGWAIYLDGARVLHVSLAKRIFPQTPVFHTIPNTAGTFLSLAASLLEGSAREGLDLEANRLF